MARKITKSVSAARAPKPTSAKAARGDGSKTMPVAALAYQLRIVPRDVSPAVWRRVVVPGALTFEGLHMVIQVTMGWQNYHLYDFEVGERRFGIPDADFGEDDSEDVGHVRLRDGGLAEGQTFLYRYDFGDGWEHDVMVEQVLKSPQEVPARARCLAGARACPPEDCGGPIRRATRSPG